jgi:hypothetical protein
MKSYRLTKNHVACRNRNLPVLLDAELCAGPFRSNTPLEGGSTARDIAMRALTKDSLPDDPHIDVDEGADRTLYLWQFVSFGMPVETIQFAEMYHKLKTRGVKLPSPVLGQSLAARRAA